MSERVATVFLDDRPVARIGVFVDEEVHALILTWRAVTPDSPWSSGATMIADATELVDAGFLVRADKGDPIPNLDLIVASDPDHWIATAKHRVGRVRRLIRRIA